MEPIPAEIRQFLAANIDALEQLEALRILSEDPARLWRTDELAGPMQTKAESAAAHIAALEGRGLVHCERKDGALFCRFGTRSSELEAQLQQLLELYRQRPVTMIRLVYERPSDPLRDFSDAFRLRKEK